MRRRLVSNLAVRLLSATDALAATGSRHQGGVMAAATARMAAGVRNTRAAGFATSTITRTLFSAASAQPGRQDPPQAQAYCSAAATSAAEVTDQMEEDAAPAPDSIEVSSSGCSRYIPAAEVAGFMSKNIQAITADEMAHVIEQVIDVYFCEMEDDSQQPSRLAGTLSDIIQTVLEHSHLRDNGEVVSRLLWGAYRLGLWKAGRTVDPKVLMTAAENTLDSCADNGMAIARELCALGGMGLKPKWDYLDRVGQRLSEEGVAQHMTIDFLILALQGATLLYYGPRTITDTLSQELLKKASEEGLDAVEVARIARFLCEMPPSDFRGQLAEQMFTQLEQATPFMDMFGVNLVLRCAAKLGHKPDPELLHTLVQCAFSQMGGAGAFHVAGPMMWALGKLGCQAGDGVVTEEFLHACVETHMNHVLLLVHDGILKTPFRIPLRGNPTSQALVDFLDGCVLLRVELTEAALQAHADLLEERCDFPVDEQELRLLHSAFNAFRFEPGVNACKARLGIYGWGRV